MHIRFRSGAGHPDHLGLRKRTGENPALLKVGNRGWVVILSKRCLIPRRRNRSVCTDIVIGKRCVCRFTNVPIDAGKRFINPILGSPAYRIPVKLNLGGLQVHVANDGAGSGCARLFIPVVCFHDRRYPILDGIHRFLRVSRRG